MEQLLILSTAENTRKVYQVAVQLFERFTHVFHLERETLDKCLTLYVTMLSILDLSPQTIQTYVGGIKSHYRLKGEMVDNQFLLKQMLQGVRKFNRGEHLKCMPVLVQYLPWVLEQWEWGRTPYEKSLFQALVLVMFHALLQVGEVTESPHNLKHSSLNVLARHFDPNTNLLEHQVVITLDFRTTKTDQCREQSQWTWFAKEESENICPVRAMLRYLALRPQGSIWLFCDELGRPLT